MEASKNTKDDKKEKASTELKEELTEDELKGGDGGGHDRMGMGGGHLLQEEYLNFKENEDIKKEEGKSKSLLFFYVHQRKEINTKWIKKYLALSSNRYS